MKFDKAYKAAKADPEIIALEKELQTQNLFNDISTYFAAYLKIACDISDEKIDQYLIERKEYDSKEDYKHSAERLGYFIHFAQNLSKIPPFKYRKMNPTLKLLADYFDLSDSARQNYLEARKTPILKFEHKHNKAGKLAAELTPLIKQLPDLD